ncbi:hypothetical protein VNO77_45132 [Canavalia gladiata]|uniref:Uncharacterized protein n=1 Tax=Canavalia gladiata TaxID=3824 RepID=A0AAN9PLS1_CANGL
MHNIVQIFRSHGRYTIFSLLSIDIWEEVFMFKNLDNYDIRWEVLCFLFVLANWIPHLTSTKITKRFPLDLHAVHKVVDKTDSTSFVLFDSTL